MKRIIHPFLFTLVSLLFLYIRAENYVSPDQIIRPLLVLWLILAAMVFPLYRMLRNWNMVGVLLSIFSFAFYFSYYFFTLIFISIVTVFVIWWWRMTSKKRKLDGRQVAVVLNSASAILILIELNFLMLNLSATRWQVYQTMWQVAVRPKSVALERSSTHPDIYYIILDGYGRADILQKYYGFDNSQFINNLSSKGFLIPSDNHSNYPRTISSVTSTLNMEYLQTMVPGLESSSLWWTMIPFLDHNVVSNSLHKIGYQTLVIATNWTPTDLRTADVRYHPYPIMLNDFESFLLDSTPLRIFKPVMQKFASVSTNESHQTVLQFNIDTLSSFPASPEPKFIFAHILSPHPPSASEYTGTKAEYMQDYIVQLTYLNSQVEAMVDAIIQHSDNPPIILLQADHGPGMFTDFDEMANTCLNERFSPLAAYYLPGLKAEDLPANITTVNLFRLIFDRYFDAGLPMLENREYSFLNKEFNFEPVDVTDRVDMTCPVEPVSGSLVPSLIKFEDLFGQ